MGRHLAMEAPVEADLVIPVPDTGISAAIGYSRESGIPFGEGLIKNRYVYRTFIQPDQHLRQLGIRMKLNPLQQAHRRQAPRRRRRLDRARQHDRAARRHAVLGRRARGAPAHQLPADHLPLLLRHRHGDQGGADRRQPLHRGDPPPRGSHLAALPHARRPAGEHRAAGVAVLPRLLHLRLPHRGPRRAGPHQAALRSRREARPAKDAWGDACGDSLRDSCRTPQE